MMALRGQSEKLDQQRGHCASNVTTLSSTSSSSAPLSSISLLPACSLFNSYFSAPPFLQKKKNLQLSKPVFCENPFYIYKFKPCFHQHLLASAMLYNSALIISLSDTLQQVEMGCFYITGEDRRDDNELMRIIHLCSSPTDHLIVFQGLC